MEPRLILKTHTECLRPALFSMVVVKYTHPSRVSSAGTVAKALKEDLAVRGLSGQSAEKREAAAKFAVHIAQKHLKLLRSNMTWDWRGQVLTAILRRAGKGEETEASGFNQLSLAERVLFLKYFLEADGALICALAAEVARMGEATRDELIDRFTVILDRIFDSYEELATGFREKTRIKNRRREAARQTKGTSRQRSTLVHKVLPHLQALVDLGIVLASDDGSLFRPVAYAGTTSLEPLAEYADRLEDLERLLGDDNPYRLISSVYGLEPAGISAEIQWPDLREVISEAYCILRDAVTGLASIRSVADWCCVVLLSEHRKLVSPRDVRYAIDRWYEQDPSAVRFHVDFQGEKAYVIFAVPEG